MGRAWDVGLHSPRGPGVPPGTGRPARSDLRLWYGDIINNNNKVLQSKGTASKPAKAPGQAGY